MENDFEQYIRLTEFFGEAVSDLFEVILFDAAKEELPVVRRKNRISKSESGTRRVVKEAMKTGQDVIINQINISENEKMIKTSVFFIKNDSGEVTGALCINIDCHPLMAFKGMIDNLLNLSDSEGEYNEEKYKDIEPSLELLERVVNDYSRDPKRLTFGERSELICDLYNLGIFDVKGSVAKAANLLGVSDKSVYRYIAKIKAARFQ